MSLSAIVEELLKKARQRMGTDQYANELLAIGSLCSMEHMEVTGGFDQCQADDGLCLCDYCQLGQPVPF